MSTEENNIPNKCLGITGAVNFKKPDKAAIEWSQELEAAINDLNIFESNEETMLRKHALFELEKFCNEWIYKKAVEHMYPDSIAKTIRAKLFTFGSYRLGVNFSGADVDALLVAPKFVSREEFFEDFLETLRSNDDAVDIHAVPNAFVPVLKMRFMGVEIDLLFARVDQVSIADTFSLSENSEQLLRNMDERDVRSVNGVRVTDDILGLVYDKRSFRSVLKIVRIWAKRRFIYSNALGFLGGVSWAILVARICQLWPLATVSTLVFNFFKFYSFKWRWPSPVMLREIEEDSGLNLVQWDPRVNPGDQNHVMPILTPSYPCQNSTYNVSESHKQFILDQMTKGLEILRQVLVKTRPYKDLFKPLFFFSFKHYLVVKYCRQHVTQGGVDGAPAAAGDTTPDQLLPDSTERKRLFREETSFIESKLRFIVTAVEGNPAVTSAVIYLRNYDSTEPAATPVNSRTSESGDAPASAPDVQVRRWVVGMTLARLEQDLMLVDELRRFRRCLGDVPVDVDHYTRKQLHQFLPEEDRTRIRDKVRQANQARAAAAAAAVAASTAATPTTPTSNNKRSSNAATDDDQSPTAVKKMRQDDEETTAGSADTIAATAENGDTSSHKNGDEPTGDSEENGDSTISKVADNQEEPIAGESTEPLVEAPQLSEQVAE